MPESQKQRGKEDEDDPEREEAGGCRSMERKGQKKGKCTWEQENSWTL